MLKIVGFLAFIAVTGYAAPQGSGKVLPIFNVIKFNNVVCASTNSISSSTSDDQFRSGVCYARQECEEKGGLVAGSCAQGFGSCCVFLRESGNVRENCTYLRNPGFPTAITTDNNNAATTNTYTIEKCAPGVCHIRLDFETFTLAGPATTGEENGGLCTDTFVATTSVGRNIPTICGVNTGQHIYLDVGTGSSNTATININLANGNAANRNWEIKVSQFLCGDGNAPPKGCFQYHEGLTGRIETFNFDSTSGHLQNHDYSSCIRREQGFCCVRYTPCPDQTNSFSLDTSTANGFTDNNCAMDYVGIEASSSNCEVSGSGRVAGSQFNSKYCGGFLNPDQNAAIGSTANAAVCDCTAPFSVDIHTDANPDVGPPNTAFSRGLCLIYTQIPC